MTGRTVPDDPPADRAVLRLRGVAKAYPGVQALRDVDLDVRAGEVLGLVGENGAGKSTLLGVLAGATAPSAGAVLLHEELVILGSPGDSHAHGIRVIPQEPALVGPLSVAENLFLDALPRRRGGLLDRAGLHDAARRRMAALVPAGTVDVEAPAETLSAAQRQLVEVAKALEADARVIAFDEPTASLGAAEAERLFGIVARLRADGVAVVYVSHRIREIRRLADRVAVLRDGELVAVRDIAAVDDDDIVRLMVGRNPEAFFARPRRARPAVALRVQGLASGCLRDVDLVVHEGEVLGVGGLVGAGRSTLVRALFGLRAWDAGRLEVGGRPVVVRSPRDAIAAGIGFTPEDRRTEGLALMRSVAENTTLAVLDRLQRGHLLVPRRERALVADVTRRLSVRMASPDQEVGALSGGNQQKVLLGRVLAAHPRVLLLDEPTKGVDVGAKAEIYEIVDGLAAEGVAVVLVSSELPELLGVSDRVAVLHDGRVTGVVDARSADEETLLRLALHEPTSPPEVA